MFRRVVTLTLLFLAATAVPAAAGIPILGRVLGAGGEPASRAAVHLEPIPATYERAALRMQGRPGPDAVADTRTAADGTFELEAPEAGPWKVVVSAAGMLTAELRLVALVEETVLPPLTLSPAADLEIRLVDVEGRPLPGAVGAFGLANRGPWRAQIRLAPAGEDGVAHLPLGRDEKIHLEILAHGYPLVIYEVSDETSIRIEVPEGVVHPVRILDRQRRPLPRAVAFQGSALLPLGASDEEGRLSLVLQAETPMEVKVVNAERWNGAFDFPPAAREEIRDLRLDPPTVVRGQVLDLATRDPVAGATVWAVRGEWVQTGSRGGYELAVGVYKSRWVQAAAAGYQQGHAQLARVDVTEAPLIALAPAATVSGKVVDEAGKLLPGVSVDLRLKPQSGQRMMSVQRAMRDGWQGRTSRSGSFRVAGVPSGIGLLLSFEAPGYAPSQLELDPLEPFERRSEIEAVMRPGRLAVGRVIDTDELPVAGAEVVLHEPPPSDDLHVAMRMMRTDAGAEGPPHLTDGEGRFEIADLAIGRYDLEVVASGYAPVTIPGLEVEDGAGQVDFGTVVVVPGVRVAGKVVDPEGAAIAGAEVYLQVEQRGIMATGRAGQKEPRARTDAGGRFEIADLLPDQLVTIVASKKGYASAAASGVKPPGEEPVSIVLQPAGRLAGRVVDERGTPIARATVNAHPDFSQPYYRSPVGQRPTWARTDAEGRFVIEDVPVTTLQVSISAEGYQQQLRSGVEMPAGGVVELEIEMLRGAVIEGTVTTADGEPLVQASLSVSERSDRMFRGISVSAGGQTDALGHYRIDGAPVGEATIIVNDRTRHRLQKDVEVRPGTNVVDLVLERGFDVTGQVVDPDGTPVGGAAVTSQATMPSNGLHVSYGSAPQATSRSDGTFVLEDVEPGSYTVSAAREGFAPSAGEPVEVSGAVSGVLLELRRGATLRGRVVGLELEELGSLSLAAFSQFGGSRRGRVDYSAEYAFDTLAPGQWHVQAQVAVSGRTSTLAVEIPEGVEEVVKDLEFGTGFSLTGVVVDGGQPVPGANVMVTSTLRSQGSSITGSDGRFRIENLAAGTYRVMVMAGFGLQHVESLELSGDRELSIALATGEISGVAVEAESGEPVAGAVVGVQSLDPGDTAPWARQLAFGQRLETDSAGRFRIPHLKAGSWRVTVTAPGLAVGEATVVVAEGVTPEVEIQLAPAEGVAFEVALESGAALPAVQVVILDPSGQRLSEGTHRVKDGTVEVSTVPAGRWELVVQGADSAATRFVVTAPGDQGRLVLPTGGTLHLRVPALEQEPFATVALRGPDGKPYVSAMGIGFGPGEWVLHGGQTMVSGLTPGVWTFTVKSGPQTWSGEATVVGGEKVESVLR